jgi:hypothetical protein
MCAQPDGAALATASTDGLVRMYDPQVPFGGGWGGGGGGFTCHTCHTCLAYGGGLACRGGM